MAHTNQFFSFGLIGTAIALSCLISSCSKPSSGATKSARPLLPVKLQPVQSGVIEDTTDYVGSLEATQRVILKPEIEGRVTQIATNNGGKVTKGNLILELQPDRTLPQVQAAVAQSQVALAALNTSKANFLAAKADRDRAATTVRLQAVQYQRVATLVAQGAQAQQALDIQTQSRDDAIAALRASDERIKAAQASIEQANSNLAQAKAQIDVASTDLQFKRIVAPIAGIVGDISVKVGDYVTPGQSLTTITRNDSLDLNIAVPIGRSTQLQTGLPVLLFVQGETKPSVTGEISFIAPEVDNTAQTVLTKARFPNSTGKLRDKQFVRAQIQWNRKPGLLIPTAAVNKVGGQNFVFVAEKQQSSNAGKANQLVARQKTVKLGEIQGQRYPVIEGLQSGEPLIVSGILSLTDGAPIKPES